MSRERGQCWKCQKRRSWIITHDDGSKEAMECSNCKWNHQRDVNKWLTDPGPTAMVDGVEVEGFMTDKRWNRKHVSFTDRVDRVESFKKWQREQADES